jgi:two-component system chemotaxis response regulator CheB
MAGSTSRLRTGICCSPPTGSASLSDRVRIVRGRRALAAVPGAFRATIADMGALLARLSREPAPASPPVPEILKLEAQLTERAMETENWNEIPGTPTRFTCLECQGAIQEIHEQGAVRFRCRVGHAYSADDLVAAKAKELEDVLWLALQTLKERAQMLDSMADEDDRRGLSRVATGCAERARETRVQADRVRAVLADVPTD